MAAADNIMRCVVCCGLNAV